MKRRTFISAGIGLAATVGGAHWLLRPPSVGSIVRGEDLGDGRRLYTGADLAFGTTMAVQVAHADGGLAARAIDDALAAAKSVDRLMTLHRDDSAVMRLNRDGRLARPDPHLLTVLKCAEDLARLSDGAFDITVQPLWRLYSAAAARGTLPSDSDRRAAMARTGWQRLQVTPQQVVLPAGMEITLNGIAQGYAVDLAHAAVAAHGIEHALLDTGEFGARGAKRERQPWTIGVRDPRDTGALVAIVPMDRRSVATSGDYETTFTADFRHHHIFDPATGDSPTELASVTVVAPSGMLADAWSTAFMVLGRERSIAMAAHRPELGLLLVDKAGARWSSPGFPQQLAPSLS